MSSHTSLIDSSTLSPFVLVNLQWGLECKCWKTQAVWVVHIPRWSTLQPLSRFLQGIWGLFLSCPLGIGSKVKAKVLNTLFFLIPSIFIALTIVFTCLQGFSQRHATHLFEKLYADLKLQDPNSSPSINQLDQAAYVFQQGAFAWHRMSQGYTYFFVFAISMTIALTGVGF